MKPKYVVKLDVRFSDFYVAGLPNNVRVTLSSEIQESVANMIQKILKENPFTVYDTGNRRVSRFEDVIIVINKRNGNITLMKPNHVNDKQTLKTAGIIVCDELLVYNLNKTALQWIIEDGHHELQGNKK